MLMLPFVCFATVFAVIASISTRAVALGAALAAFLVLHWLGG